MKIPAAEAIDILIDIVTVFVEAAVQFNLRMCRLRPVGAVDGRRRQGHAGAAAARVAALTVCGSVGEVRGSLSLLARAPDVFQFLHWPVFVCGPRAAVGVLLPTGGG